MYGLVANEVKSTALRTRAHVEDGSFQRTA